MDDRAGAAVRLLVGALVLGVLAGGVVLVRTVAVSAAPYPWSGCPSRARSALRSVDVVETRIAGDRPDGEVVDQEAAPCTEPVRLLVNDSGPAVAAGEPQPYRDLLGDPGGDQLVRLIRTTEGEAGKSDALLWGSVRPPGKRWLRWATTILRPCRRPLEQRLLDVVLSATTSWWGEPPLGGRGARSVSTDKYLGTAWGARRGSTVSSSTARKWSFTGRGS